MRRLIAWVLCVLLLAAAFPAAAAAESDAAMTAAADLLCGLGLFRGVAEDAEGNPVYALERIPTRAEAVVMLVRLLGKEAEAEAGEWNTPFTDPIPDWAAPCIGYAYENGLTNGKSEKRFGSSDPVSAPQFLTLILRALGYESGTDFQWERAWELTDKLGLTRGLYDETTGEFLRGDIALICSSALEIRRKGSEETLAELLIKEGVISRLKYRQLIGLPVTDEELFEFTYIKVQDAYIISGALPDERNGGELLIPAEHEGKPVIAVNAVLRTTAELICIPASVVSICDGAFEDIPNCTAFLVDEKNPCFCAMDGVLMSADGTELWRYPEAKPGAVYRIPDAVREILPYAFRGAGKGAGEGALRQAHELEEIVIPAGVREVEAGAFSPGGLSVRILGDSSRWVSGCLDEPGLTVIRAENEG